MRPPRKSPIASATHRAALGTHGGTGSELWSHPSRGAAARGRQRRSYGPAAWRGELRWAVRGGPHRHTAPAAGLARSAGTAPAPPPEVQEATSGSLRDDWRGRGWSSVLLRYGGKEREARKGRGVGGARALGVSRQF